MDVGGERAVAPPAQPHRFGSGGSGVGGSEFFICFTSRPSSSASMRIPSSKSLPSPGRADKYRDPAGAAPSLSASLSRRLKSSGSVKGGQSPATMLAGGGSRRKSCAFEAAEPSSPKVTCIGQVKVKTARMKKKRKTTTLRSASQRAGRGGGEATFRKLEERGGEGEVRDGRDDRDCLPSRNQRWAHLPLGGICDALRAFGSEFNCLFPCGGGGGRTLCASFSGAERGEARRTGGVAQGDGVAAEKRARGGGMGSCGAALARWLMAVHDGGEGAKRPEMVELVVVDEVDGRGVAREVRGMEVLVDGEKGGPVAKERESGLGGAAPPAAAATAEDDGEAVCVPPPNALLLMRCRSDPVRMAALATRFWGSPAAASVRVEVDEEDHEEEDEEEEVADHKGEEPGNAAQQGPEGGAQAGAASIATETVLKGGGPSAMADEEGSRICRREAEGEVGKMLSLQGVDEQQHCQGKGERDDGGGHCAEAAPELDEDDVEEDGEEAPEIEKAAAEREDASGGTPNLVVCTEQSELLLPAAGQERAAAAAPAAGGKEVAATKSLKPILSSAVELHGRRPSFSNEKDEGKRSSAKEFREGRRHSFSTEKDARRTSSFRDKEGRRSSFSVEGDFRRPCLSGEGEGRRRWSFSSEKEARRPVPVDTTAAAAAAVVMDKKRRKKKKKEGEEGSGAAREDDLVVEVRSFERPIAAAAAPPAAAEEARRRGEKRDELPDCLLLMMYEPKLSMEVSRETWVCTSDFLRFRPHHHRPQAQPPPQAGMGADPAQGGDAGDGGAAENKADVTASSDAVSLPHPPPPPPAPPTAPAPAATSPSPEPPPPPEAEKTPEKKPAGAAASSPFGLTRCKSEPMRSAAKMEPDACFWKSRHRPIGAAGIGF